ncbi:MAG TPA: Yip1 family protein [Thermoanaerobaculia bacterium]|nr:Yip1 family protein [Thermoanaerobaculia bacterium]
MAYGPDILEERDPARRMQNLQKLIAERQPTEILVLTAISILSDDSEIRRVALERLDERNAEEGNASARVAVMIDSWRREGALMTWPQPMDARQSARAARIERAHRARMPLASAAPDQEMPPAQAQPAAVDSPRSAASAPAPRRAAVAVPAAKNPFQRIAGVLVAPAETFRDIAARPDILVPLLIIVIAFFIAAAVVVPRLDWTAGNEIQVEAIKKQDPSMPQEDIDQRLKIANAAQKVTSWLSPLFWIVGYVIVAGVLLLAFRILGGEGTFKQAFSITLYSWIPIAIFRIIRAIVVAARGTVDVMDLGTVVKSNPAFLLDFREQPIPFALLGALDVFSIWTLVLLIIGFAAMSKFSKGKSAAIVIAFWIVLVLIGAGLAAFGAAGMKKA